jgi:hypothetical protein
MKTPVIILSFLLVITGEVCSQDTIYLNNGQFIPGKVKQVTESKVLYIAAGNPTRKQDTLSSSDVRMIRYSWGHKKYNQRLDNEGNIRKDRPWGVSLNFLSGTLPLGISVDYFVIPELSLEAGLGISQYIAVKYHFMGGMNSVKCSPFIGVAYGISPFIYSSDNYIDEYDMGILSFPLGFHFIGKRGFSFSLALALCMAYDKSTDHLLLWPWPGIRIGYHF